MSRLALMSRNVYQPGAETRKTVHVYCSLIKIGLTSSLYVKKLVQTTFVAPATCYACMAMYDFNIFYQVFGDAPVQCQDVMCT